MGEEKAQAREAHEKAIAPARKAYDEANKDKVNEHQKTYYESNRDRIREQKRAYYKANRDRIREQQRAHREASREIKELEDRCMYLTSLIINIEKNNEGKIKSQSTMEFYNALKGKLYQAEREIQFSGDDMRSIPVMPLRGQYED